MTPTESHLLLSVIKHLFEMPRRSVVETRDEDGFGTEICAYRTDSGNRCAVGFLIKDEFYSPEIEGIRIDGHEGLKVREAVVRSIGFQPTESFWNSLSDLQFFHDKAINWNVEGFHLSPIFESFFNELKEKLDKAAEAV